MPRIVIFLSIASAIFYIANVVVYEALALTFSLSSPNLVVLGTSLGLLSAGFIGATILGNWYYNFLTRIVYRALAVWMGTFAYVFFASLALGVVVALASFVAPSFPAEITGIIFFAVALLVSLYGTLNSRRIKIARYSVTLPNLPAAWKGKKAIFVSDLHLGQFYGPTFARKVTNAINALAPEIIFIGGDLFDGTRAPDLNTLTAPLKNLSAPWGTYFITGNHEEFNDASVFLEVVRSLGMKVLTDEMVDVHGLQLVGVDYHNANTADGFKTILNKLALDTTKPSILLKHEPNNLDIAEAAHISLQLSGHTHKGQQWPFGYLAQLSYKGFAYGLKNHGTLQQLTSSGVGTWGPPLRVASSSEIVEITFTV